MLVGDGRYLTEPIFVESTADAIQHLMRLALEDHDLRRYSAVHLKGRHIVQIGNAPMHPLEANMSRPLHERRPNYATCQGPSDPVCGLVRLSTHGCNPRR